MIQKFAVDVPGNMDRGRHHLFLELILQHLVDYMPISPFPQAPDPLPLDHWWAWLLEFSKIRIDLFTSTCSSCSEMAAFVLWFPDPVRSRPRLWFEREPVSMVHTGTRSLFLATSPHSPSPLLSPYTPNLQETLPRDCLHIPAPSPCSCPSPSKFNTVPI